MATPFSVRLFPVGILKEKVCTPKPETLVELKSAIRREMRAISSEMCSNVIQNFKSRLDIVVTQNGRHLEHIV